MHHGNDADYVRKLIEQAEEAREGDGGLTDKLANKARNTREPPAPSDGLNEEAFGATGRSPNGRLDKSDQGEIRFGITSDASKGLVFLSFHTPVMWLGMTGEQAAELGRYLIEQAESMEPG